MHERPILAEIQVPPVGVERQAFGLDARDQLVVVVLALTPSDDLPYPSGASMSLFSTVRGSSGFSFI